MNMKNKNLLKKLIGTLLMSTMTFTSTSVLNSLAGFVWVQNTQEIKVYKEAKAKIVADINKLKEELNSIVSSQTETLSEQEAKKREEIEAKIENLQKDLAEIEKSASTIIKISKEQLGIGQGESSTTSENIKLSDLGQDIKFTDIEQFKNITEISPHALTKHANTEIESKIDVCLLPAKVVDILNSVQKKDIKADLYVYTSRTSDGNSYVYSLNEYPALEGKYAESEKRREIRFTYKDKENVSHNILITTAPARRNTEIIVSLYKLKDDEKSVAEMLQSHTENLEKLKEFSKTYKKGSSNYLELEEKDKKFCDALPKEISEIDLPKIKGQKQQNIAPIGRDLLISSWNRSSFLFDNARELQKKIERKDKAEGWESQKRTSTKGQTQKGQKNRVLKPHTKK